MRKKNQALWNHLKENIKDFKVEAGFFEGKTYPDGTPISGVAAVQNYGAHIRQNVTAKQRSFLHYAGIHLKNTTNELNIIIPPRPFMDNARKRIEGKEGLRQIEIEFTRILAGKQTIYTALQRLGEWAKEVIQEEIARITHPTLAPNTLKMRDANAGKPLMATEKMYNSVEYRIEEL